MGADHSEMSELISSLESMIKINFCFVERADSHDRFSLPFGQTSRPERPEKETGPLQFTTF